MMNSHIFTDGLATIAACIAVFGAVLLFTGPKSNQQEAVYDQASWTEAAAPARLYSRPVDG